MTSKFVKLLSIVVLLVGLVARSSEMYRIGMALVVSVAALMIFGQALRTRNYFWGAGFLSIAVLFNPLIPVTVSGWRFLLLDLACATTFAISLVALRAKPLLSVNGIINPQRRIESL